MKNNIYEKNIAVVEAISPDLRTWIEAGEKPDWLRIIRAENGSDNIIITSSVDSLPLYSMKSPEKEARKESRNVLAHKQHAAVIVGIGLGYLLSEILKKMEPGHKVIVADIYGYMVRIALERHDFTKWLSNGTLLLCTTAADLAYMIGFLETNSVVEEWNLTLDPIIRHRADYRELGLHATRVINQSRANVSTVESSGWKIASNGITTLPYVIRHRGVLELKDLFKGKPIVTVATGPSLERNVHVLAESKDRVVIVAVGQALRILLAYDIRPDLACTVDFGRTNITHYEGLMDCGVPLVCLDRTYAPLIRRWSGPKFIVSTPVPGLEETAVGVLGDKGSLEMGGSVAHLCYSLAHHMGGNPIVLIGQDLALGERSHISQVDSGGRVAVDAQGIIQWSVEDPRSQLHAQTYSMGPATYVKGYFGRPVLTNMGLLSFITSFEGMCRLYSQDGTDTINATEGGAHIEGMRRMSLKKVIEEYCAEPIDKVKMLAPYLTLANDADDLIDVVIPRLRLGIENLGVLVEKSKTGLETVSRMLEIAGQPTKTKELQRLMDENEAASRAAHDAAKRDPLVAVAIYNENRAIHAREYAVKSSKAKALLKSGDSLRKRIERNKLILGAAHKRGKELLRCYVGAEKILSRYRETRSHLILDTAKDRKPRLDDAEEMLKLGLFAKPLLEARRRLVESPHDWRAQEIHAKCMSLRYAKMKEARTQLDRDSEIEYVELIEKSRKIGHDDKNWEEALHLLDKAEKIRPGELETLWGRATTLHHLGRTEESAELYGQLCEKEPTNHRFAFERGRVLIRTGNTTDGFAEIRKAMTASKEYNWFLRDLGMLYKKCGLLDEAVQALDAYVIDVNPYSPEALMALADCLDALGLKRRARKEREKALKIDPTFKNHND